MPHFEGKTVFCNCDDPRFSNFWNFYKVRFNDLKLKRLVATHYQPATLYEESPAYKLEWDGEQETLTFLEDNGDFASDECKEIMKEADIISTNPPFSLFRKYVAQLMEHRKKFLIIGHMGCVTYKEIFPLFMDNRMWRGCSIKSGDRWFGVPIDYPLTAANSHVDENGRKYIKVKGVRWFTNLQHDGMNNTLPLYKRYTPEKYPTYDNYDAIEVGYTKDIPLDYDGEMGVPISFLDRYSPKQFEIVGLCRHLLRKNGGGSNFILNGSTCYMRIVIRHK